MAHHADTCKADDSFCTNSVFEEFTCGPLDQFGNPDAICVATTGNAGFCANTDGFLQAKNCLFCRKDADCVVAGFPAGFGVCAPAGEGNVTRPAQRPVVGVVSRPASPVELRCAFGLAGTHNTLQGNCARPPRNLAFPRTFVTQGRDPSFVRKTRSDPIYS